MENILKRIHHKDAPNRTRTVPMEVLALGISRSGTESMREALRILGYNDCYHGFKLTEGQDADLVAWNQAAVSKHQFGGQNPPLDTAFFDKILGDCMAITDLPAVAFPRELIQAYPDAKVVLNVRDIEPWYRSFSKAILPMETMDPLLRYLNKDLFWMHYGFMNSLIPGFFRGNWAPNAKWVYEEHAATVRGSVPSDRLLEWHLGDGWEPLCAFLGKPVPDQPFPSGNAGDDFSNRLAEILSDAKYSAYKNLALGSAGLVGVVTAVAAGFSFYS